MQNAAHLSLRCPGDQPEAARQQAEQLQEAIGRAAKEGRFHQMVPFSGQTVGLIHEIEPAGEIVETIVREAEEILARFAKQG